MKSLLSCALFKNIPEEELDLLFNCLSPINFDYKRNEIILNQGDRLPGVGVLIKGTAEISKETYSGERVIIGLLKNADIFGEVGALLPPYLAPSTITAIKPCQVFYLPNIKFWQTCAKACPAHARMTANILTILAQKTQNLNKQLGYLMIRSLRERIMAFLLDFSAGEKVFSLNISRKQMAEIINASRPALSRELSRMKKDGLIDFEGHSFKILS